MATKMLLTIATGNASYDTKAAQLKSRLAEQIPTSLRLPASILSNLPLDVTGIPASCGFLSPEELAITELDATAICEKIAAGKLTAVETVTAFGKRAAIAQQLSCCLVDFFLDEGIAQAKELDEYFRREGKVIGPLHGLPISIKDHIPIKGRWASGGFLANVEVSKEDCDMTSILRRLGAVFYVKTNQPQTIMHLESHSVYGRTLNPHNTNLTPGGSSGGESALLALKGSPLGVGTDGGGSIRNPCSNCGLYGIRPTTSTMPTRGYLFYQPGCDAVLTSTGPMCQSARDMNLFISVVRSAQPFLLDPSMIPMPWSVPSPSSLWGASTGRKLRVGVMVHDGVVMPHPPMLRALELAKSKLAASDEVEVIDFKPYQHDIGYDIIRELYFEDGGNAIRMMLKEGGENSLPLTDWVILPSHTKDHDAAGMWALRYRKEVFRKAYSDHWLASGCDVLLLAPFPGCANMHDTARYWAYTAIWNLLDYPGVVFPTGIKVDPSIDVLHPQDEVMSPADAYNRSIYDADAMIGAPINLQLIARRFGDEMLLAAQEVVERIIKA
ncbi:hypothetical protein JAAARDRAFT_163030 [Jaapia argillacea MUCL 33604]|uniref:amidase n=1 Tax=Jaapia argillacea MUCL 33604 TaxID=933084 RepID=A0A067PM67_9AGAM|nr:hypothetical protein JAAARDRAFT_163030 [Jaapia argillacea MUCL 33604]